MFHTNNVLRKEVKIFYKQSAIAGRWTGKPPHNLEIIVTAENVFLIANSFALCGWLVLIFAVLLQQNWLRDRVAGFWWPIILSVAYALLIVLFFGKAEGGFDTLANVKKLFTSDWAAVAGWVHYLAFDLFIGSWIAKEIADKGITRLWLAIILPATFMLGPVGLVLFTIAKHTSGGKNSQSAAA